MRYEDSVRKICGDDWKTISLPEKEGGMGVAIVQAYLRGTRPALNDMATHLGVPADEIYAPFNRLAKSGVFSKAWDTKKDPYLTSRDIGDYNFGWSHIAGLACGYIGNY